MAKRKDGGGNTTPRRYKGGRPRGKIDLEIGTDAYKKLRTLANAQGVSPEGLATAWLLMKIEAEWQEYTAGVAEEWELDGTLEPTPKDVFTAAREAIEEMGGAEKLKQKEDPAIIV